ncbi:hypothetical protein AB0N38_26405 [Micromonospora aurantiaca]|uniref:hypothetical protein n=1 Tax=Micromonospora aurantiaca (nom. illeg.) TaxID=47850 RepID=UPI003422A064
MTDNIDTNAIRKLTNAADDGPWTAHSTGLVWAERLGDPVSASADRANSAFIAAARTFVPQLCDEIDRLRAELAQIADAVAPTVTITPTVDAVRFLHRLYTDWVATAHERLAKVDEQAAEIAGLTAANQRLLNHLHNATPDLVTAQQRADQAEDRAADLANRLHRAEQEIASHNKAVTAWANQVEKLKKQLGVRSGTDTPASGACGALAEGRGIFRCDKPAGHTGDRHHVDFGVGSYTWGYVPTEPEKTEVVAAAIRTVDADIERGTRPIASAVSTALSRIGEEWHPGIVNDVIGEMDGWDEVGAEELAHHIITGLAERARGDRKAEVA